jgi:hypothetical protein
VTVVFIGIAPLDVPHWPDVHDHVPEVAPAGSASVTVALVAVEGPAFETVTV